MCFQFPVPILDPGAERRHNSREAELALRKMYLMKTEDGKYTLKKVSADGKPARSAHPCRFSPDDKFSRHRVTIKKRFGTLILILGFKSTLT